MMRHLEDAHGIRIDIPKRPMGRPKGNDKPPLPTSSRSSRQCKKRFDDIQLRINNARKKHKRDKERIAFSTWSSLKENDKPSFEVWRESWIVEKMAQWESNLPQRISRMQATIDRGYDASVRLMLPYKKSNLLCEFQSSF